jgi:hypothetical protein
MGTEDPVGIVIIAFPVDFNPHQALRRNRDKNLIFVLYSKYGGGRSEKFW